MKLRFYDKRPPFIMSAAPAGAFAAFLALVIFLVPLAHASGGEAEGGRNWADFGWRAFNFAVLAGFFYWLLAKKVKDFFRGRREDIRTALSEAVAAKEEAEKKFREYDAKLDKASEEIKAMSEMILKQGIAEKERIVADARRIAGKIREDAEKRMQQEIQQARKELKEEAVRLSVALAEEMLKKQITAADHNALVEEYIDKVVSRN